jgi:hypothetical protein
MEESYSWEANSFSGSQEISRIVEQDSSLPYSKEPDNSPCPEPGKSSTRLTVLFLDPF